jgi:protein-disulfide isomerase
MRHIWWISTVFALALASLARAESTPSPAPDDVALGKPDAPVTIFEYASLTCPHCAEFDALTLPNIRTNWIDTGKARLIFRDFPLDQNALKAAAVARCAPPDQFFNFIDVLFKNQVNWAVGSPDEVTQALSRIARLGGISEDKFNACINDKALNDRILGERLAAQNDYGVDSTPTFFVNGKKVVGALPYDQFSEELAAAMPGGTPVANAAPAPQGPSTPAAATPATAQDDVWWKRWYHWLKSYL